MLLGIDIGGTAIKAGAVGLQGKILARRQIPFNRSLSFETVAQTLEALAGDLQAVAGERAGSLGICMPGFADAGGQLVDGGANIPALRERSIVRELEARLGIPVRIENDGVAAAIGEANFGAGRGLRRFALMTIGTGVGGAIFIDGSVVKGAGGEPPELGAIIPDWQQPSRTLESLACARAFLTRYRELGGLLETDALPDLFAQLGHDDVAERTVEEISAVIASVFANFVNALNLEACLVGGGVAGAGERLLGPIRSHLARLAWPMLARNTKVMAAAQGNDAGLLGAAWLSRDQKLHVQAAQ